MKTKNIFILIAIIIIVAIIVLAIILKYVKPLNNGIPADNKNNNTNSDVPPLSGSESGLQVSQRTAGIEDMRKQINSNIEAAEKSNSKTSEFTAKTWDGKIMPFRNFLQSNDVKIDESVLKLSDEQEYSQFNCSLNYSAFATGLIFEVNKNQDLKSYLNSVDPLTESVEKWEKNMFQDLAPLFFPGESFSQSPKFSENRFDTSNGINAATIRYANLKADSGKTFSIDWSMFFEQIFISNDKDCLRQQLNKHQEALEP